MILIFVMLFLFLGVVNISILLNELRSRGWSLFTYSLIYLIIFFNILPVISFLFIDKWDRFPYIIPDFNLNSEVVFLLSTSITLGFLSFYLGYYCTKDKFSHKKSILIQKKIKGYNIKDILIFFICILSTVGLIMYVNGFGSLNNAIANAHLVRSGLYTTSEEFDDTSHTFFFRFIFISLIPVLYFFTLKHKTFYYKIIFGLSIVTLVILYFFLSAGRQSIVDFFLIFIFCSLVYNKKIINWQLITIGVSALIILPFLEVFVNTNQLNFDHVDYDFKKTMVVEFGFPFYSLYYSIENKYDYFYFSDFISGIYGKILPSYFNPGIERTSFINTFFVTGEKGRATVPPGLFAQGYYSLGLLGVVLISGFTGWFFKKIDLFFRNLLNIDSKYTIFYTYFIVNSMVWVRTGVPGNYFYGFTFLVLWIFLFLSYKIKKI